MRSPRRAVLLALVLLVVAAPSAHATLVRTVAGGPPLGPTNFGHADSSLSVGFGAPQAVAMAHGSGADGLDYYVADTNGCRIFKVNATSAPGVGVGPIDAVLGLTEICRGSADFFFNHVYNAVSLPPSGNEVKLLHPGALASLADGRLLWSENGQGRVHALGTDNFVDTIVGSGTCGTAPDSATAA